MIPSPTPAASPQGAGGPPPQAAPFGASGAMGPSPNAGHEAAGRQALGSVLQQLSRIVTLVGASSELGVAISKAIGSLGKHVQPGQAPPAANANHLQAAQMQNLQQQQMAQMMQQRMAAQGAGAGGGGGGPPAAPQGMM